MTEKTERIVLPRSGLVLRLLERDVVHGNLYRADIPVATAIRDRRRASCGLVTAAWIGDLNRAGSLDECIAWLDDRVLSLRSALLSGAEETVARWIVDNNAGRYGRSWDDTPECQRDDARALAQSLISALCGEEGSRG